MSTILDGVWHRVVTSYKSTLIGLGCGVGIILVDSFSTYLQALPQGWAKGVAALLMLAGAAFKDRALPPSPPPAP